MRQRGVVQNEQISSEDLFHIISNLLKIVDGDLLEKVKLAQRMRLMK